MEDPRADRVADHDARHLDEADAARAPDVEADDRRHAGEADEQACEPPPVEPLAAGRRGEGHADERGRREEQRRE